MGYALGRKVNISKARTAWFFVLYAIGTIIAYTLPMFKITLPYVAVALLLIASLLFFMYKNVKWLYFSIILCITSAIVMSINMMTGIYGLVEAANEMIRNIRFFIPILWGCYVIKNCNEKQRKFVLIAFGLMSVFILFKTLQAIEEIPSIVRDLAQGATRESVLRTSYRMRNVGGFEYSYMMGIVTIGFTWTCVHANNKIVRIASLAIVVLCYYFIIQTMYTLLLILTTVGVFLIIFFSTKNVIVKALLMIVLFLLLLFMEPFLKFLSELFSFNFGLEEKFTNMYLALKFKDVDIMGTRPEMLKTALLHWVDSPIFGGAHKDSNTHSLIMTILENSGIIGISAWLGFFFSGWRMLKNELQEYSNARSLWNTVMIYVFVLSLLNPVGYVFEVVFIAYFIIPVWITVVNDNNNKMEA